MQGYDVQNENSARNAKLQQQAQMEKSSAYRTATGSIGGSAQNQRDHIGVRGELKEMLERERAIRIRLTGCLHQFSLSLAEKGDDVAPEDNSIIGLIRDLRWTQDANYNTAAEIERQLAG